MVSRCNECLDHRNRQQKETIIEHDVSATPWEKEGTDLLTIYGKEYIVAVDYYSKFFEITLLSTPSNCSDVVNALKKMFSSHGVPKLLFIDNGPHFAVVSLLNYQENGILTMTLISALSKAKWTS